MTEHRWCVYGRHTLWRIYFYRKGKEQSRCHTCNIRRNAQNQPIIPQPLRPPPPVPPPVATVEDEIPLDTFRAAVDAKDMDALAVSTKDWDLIRNYYGKLAKLERVSCDVCNEIGFNINMNLENDGPESICVKCRFDCIEPPPRYSADNEMDPGPIPAHLPELTMAEEMLIARAHVQMEMSRVKGCQYKYRGHVISWMQNVPRIIQKLPSLPQELQVLIIKPISQARRDSEPSREYQRRFRVRRQYIETWLNYLVQHHPDYRGMQIDYRRLHLCRFAHGGRGGGGGGGGGIEPPEDLANQVPVEEGLNQEVIEALNEQTSAGMSQKVFRFLPILLPNFLLSRLLF